jgi:lactoylglutathione lyase
MFQEIFPILSTPDLPRALAFYRDGLGFEVTYQFPADGEPAYVALKLGGSSLGLAAESAVGAASDRFAIWAYVDDCDAAVDRLRGFGTTVTQEPADQPWGERIAYVTDPDGNRIIVGERAGSRA